MLKKEERFKSCGDCGGDEEELASTSGRRIRGASRATRTVWYQKPANDRSPPARD